MDGVRVVSNAMNYENIKYYSDGTIATITLSSPPLNIITIAMMSEINAALKSSIEESVDVVVFEGAGEKAFSAGVEISEHTPELVETMLISFHDIFRTLAHAQQKSALVTVAKVKGHCLGGGCELACFCDVVIASDSAKIGTPEIILGCYPPVAAALFPAMLGRKQAERLMFSGEIINSQHAQRIGLVTDVVADSELDDRVATTVEAIANKSAAVLRLLRKSEPEWRTDFLSQLDIAERVYLTELTKLDDMQEGILAYQQKRAPVWKNQ